MTVRLDNLANLLNSNYRNTKVMFTVAFLTMKPKLRKCMYYYSTVAVSPGPIWTVGGQSKHKTRTSCRRAAWASHANLLMAEW